MGGDGQDWQHCPEKQTSFNKSSWLSNTGKILNYDGTENDLFVEMVQQGIRLVSQGDHQGKPLFTLRVVSRQGLLWSRKNKSVELVM